MAATHGCRVETAATPSARLIAFRLEGTKTMAGIREMGLGIASALGSGAAPNPLPVELWGYTPEDAARLLKYIINECTDANIALEQVTADPIVVQELSGTKSQSGIVYAGVPVIADPASEGRMNIHCPRMQSNSD